DKQKKVCVAMNAIMHNDRINKVVQYAQSLQEIGVDSITVGDPGVIHLFKKKDIQIPSIYDAHNLVMSANQVHFLAKSGNVCAVLERELTYEELEKIAADVYVLVEILVYGATCIHQSKRPLVKNYFNFTEQHEQETKDLFISEAKNPDTHYS